MIGSSTGDCDSIASSAGDGGRDVVGEENLIESDGNEDDGIVLHATFCGLLERSAN